MQFVISKNFGCFRIKDCGSYKIYKLCSKVFVFLDSTAIENCQLRKLAKQRDFSRSSAAVNVRSQHEYCPHRN